MGTYGTFTGIVRWYDADEKVGYLLALKDGNVVLQISDAGVLVQYNEQTDRIVYGGSPRIPYGGSPRIPYGGSMSPALRFIRDITGKTFGLYQSEDALIVGFSPNRGADSYAKRWQFFNNGAFSLPRLASAPTNPSDGMIAIADGVGWNPGSGAGLYEYRGGWQKL